MGMVSFRRHPGLHIYSSYVYIQHYRGDYYIW